MSQSFFSISPLTADCDSSLLKLQGPQAEVLILSDSLSQPTFRKGPNSFASEYKYLRMFSLC